MLQSTQGFVLSTIKYSETSVITKIYTNYFGLRTYIVNGVRTPKGRAKAAMLQPLNNLDLVVYERENASINRIKEIKFAKIYTRIPFDVKRSAIALFLTEVLYKVIKEETANTEFYELIESIVLQLEHYDEHHLSNLPVFYLIQLTQLLGFYPDNNFSASKKFFDLKEGNFTTQSPIVYRIADELESNMLNGLLSNDYDDWKAILINKNQRKLMLLILLNFYDWHVENFGKIKSLNVLEKIF